MNYTKIKNKKIRTEIYKLMSDMLDNPDETGIYPTAKFMSEMEDYCLKIRHEAIGWTWAKACTQLDKGKDPREHEQSILITDANADLDKDF